MSHQITLEELREWISEENPKCYASSLTEDKQLYVTFGGGFEVYHNGRMVCYTLFQPRAVEKYNSL